MEEQELRFDGSTYSPQRDRIRLTSQTAKVWAIVRDGNWHTLSEIAHATGASEASVSARLRDLRKERFGAMIVTRQHLGHGLYQYRVAAAPHQEQA